MKRKVYYTSGKIASELAAVIAASVSAHPECLFPAYMPDGVDLMFLGCDGSHADSAALQFAASLKPDRVRYAALFNANSKMCSKAIEEMHAVLSKRGIIVLENALICMGKPFQRELPAFDRTSALDFANASMREVMKRGSANMV